MTTRYVVTSDLVAGHAKGATVTAEDLPGCDLGALMDAKHIAPAPAKKAPARKRTAAKKES